MVGSGRKIRAQATVRTIELAPHYLATRPERATRFNDRAVTPLGGIQHR